MTQIEMNTNLWSARWSTAKGWYWKLERDMLLENVQGWLAVFQKDEPEIFFAVSDKMPSKKELLNVTNK